MPKSEKRRFAATQQSTVNDLRRILERLGATSLKIDQGIGANASVTVVFDRNGMRYTRRCAVWPNALDNLRAIGLQIDCLYRALNVYGPDIDAAQFEQEFAAIFGGLLATPDDAVLRLKSGTDLWFEVLGVSQEADVTAIKNAYRALARAHPDTNDAPGAVDEFRRIHQAYSDGLAVAQQREKRK